MQQIPDVNKKNNTAPLQSNNNNVSFGKLEWDKCQISNKTFEALVGMLNGGAEKAKELFVGLDEISGDMPIYVTSDDDANYSLALEIHYGENQEEVCRYYANNLRYCERVEDCLRTFEGSLERYKDEKEQEARAAQINGELADFCQNENLQNYTHRSDKINTKGLLFLYDTFGEEDVKDFIRQIDEASNGNPVHIEISGIKCIEEACYTDVYVGQSYVDTVNIDVIENKTGNSISSVCLYETKYNRATRKMEQCAMKDQNTKDCFDALSKRVELLNSVESFKQSLAQQFEKNTSSGK